MSNSTYIIGGVVVVLLVIVVYFLFFRKGDEKKDVKKKKSNLYIAAKATGAIVEEYEAVFTEKSCEIIADMIFGKDADGGLNVIYEDVMGKKFPQERFKCKGRSEEDVKSDTQKISNQHIVDMYAAILKNKDVKKRNSDLVAMWVLLGNGIAKATIPDMFHSSVERDGDEIKTFQFSLKDDRNDTIMFTPRTLILSAEKAAERGDEEPERKLIKKLATPLVNSQEIEKLKNDTNPKMSLDTLASVIIYELSKKGFSSPFI